MAGVDRHITVPLHPLAERLVAHSRGNGCRERFLCCRQRYVVGLLACQVQYSLTGLTGLCAIRPIFYPNDGIGTTTQVRL
jgi:hypothetical protein